jgi:hypothetical protein
MEKQNKQVIDNESEVSAKNETQPQRKKLSKNAIIGIIAGAIAALAIIITIICLPNSTSNSTSKENDKSWYELYDTNLAGKTFESDGRTLTFDNNKSMTYNYINGIGDSFKYVYSILNITEENNKLILKLKQTSATNNSDNTDKDKEITATYYKANDSIEYYSSLYITKSPLLTYAQELYNEYLLGKKFESDGRVLIFDASNCMTYNFTNLSGTTYRYTYSIIDIVAQNGNLKLSLKEIASINDSDNVNKGGIETATYSIVNNKVIYYSSTYTQI